MLDPSADLSTAPPFHGNILKSVHDYKKEFYAVTLEIWVK